MCPPPWLIPPHIARGTTAPLRPMPDILHPAATATLCCFCAHFSTVLLLLCPVSLYFSPHCPAFSLSPCVIMAVQGCGGQGFLRL